MPPKKVQTKVSVRATTEQIQAARDAADKRGIEYSEFIRLAIRKAVIATGTHYPDNLTRRGQYKRPTK